MDGSQAPLDKRYVLLNKELADVLERLDDEDLEFLLAIATGMDCECGCRGTDHAADREAA